MAGFEWGLLLSAGAVSFGMAVANARRTAREKPRAEAWAREQGWSCHPATGQVAYRLVGERRGLPVRIDRIHSSGKVDDFSGFEVWIGLSEGLPRGLSARLHPSNHGKSPVAKLELSCEDPHERGQLRRVPGLVASVADLIRAVPESHVDAGGFEFRVARCELAELLALIDQRVQLMDHQQTWLRWEPGGTPPARLPPPDSSTIGAEFEPLPEPQSDDADSPARVGGRVGELVAALEAGAVRESEGAFTLDAGKAMERYRSARLERRGAYSLDLLRALVARGASRIEVNGSLREFTVRADGPPYSAEELEHAGRMVLSSGTGARAWSARHLALGIQGALGLNPRRVQVDSGATRMILTPHAESPAIEPRDSPAAGTEVTVFNSAGAAFAGVESSPLLVAREARMISNPEIWVGDRRRSVRPDEVCQVGRVSISRPGIVGLIGFHVDSFQAGAQVLIGQHGVVLDVADFPGRAAGYRAVFMLDEPDTDASGAKLVQGRQRAQLHWLAEEALPRAYAALGAELEQTSAPGSPRLAAARKLARRALQRAPTRDLLEAGPAAALAGAPLWPVVDGHLVSARALIEQYASVGRIGYRRVPGAPVSRAPTPGIVLDAARLDPFERALLQAWFGGALVDVDLGR